MTGQEMVGISRYNWFFILVAFFATLSCVKEEVVEQPVENQPERLTEYDPVVRFGLETYMGGDEETKTIYAGEDEYDLVFDEALGKYIRYERINWNCGPVTNPEDKLDTVRIWSNALFTKKDNIKSADYSPGTIPGVTNKTGNIKDSAADAKIVSTDEKDNFYWDLSKDPRYFFAVYPTPTDRTSLSVTEPSGTPPTVSVSGRIPRYQEYLRKKETGNVIEYLPDMSNAYMYAASKIPSADAGYVKVPLRFKPLFSAVKLKMQSAVGGEKYRLKKVELRTDLFYDDLHQNDPKRVNKPNEGTALNGKFTATFSTTPSGDAKKPEYTGDFTVTSCPVLSSDSDTTYKRLTIYIKEGDRVWLNDEEVNVTFLALPILQEVMTIVYTFEVNDGLGNPEKDDKGKIIEVTRYLALQQKTNKKDNTGTHSEFQKEDWYQLPGATKLYVKSNVPEIQYYFDVFMQGNLPRTWKAGSKQPQPKSGESFPDKNFFEAKDFYAVMSYRDSAGILQPLRWRVTGYRENAASGPFSDTPPSWLHLRGDGPWTKRVPFDVMDSKHPGYPYVTPSTPSPFDPWDVPQGQGTRMTNSVDKGKNPVSEESPEFVGYLNIDHHAYTYYDAGGYNKGARKWEWTNHGSYIHSTPNGEFLHHQNDGVDYPDIPGGWAGDKTKGEAYAYDLSSHNIYGKLTADFNGDISHANTANCYVVSAPGWYRFPAVYGNALKDGADNIAAYNKNGSPAKGIMGAFLDHTGKGISGPWIPYTIKSVDVLWDDANHIVAQHATKSIRTDRSAFCATIGGMQYIYFYVDDIAQGNVVIAAKDETDTIVWSWHIWAVADPDNYLKEVTVKSNEIDVNGSNNQYKSHYTAGNTFWKDADLGQNGKESTVENRYCDVEFTQFFKGRVVAKVVRRVLQSGVKDDADIAPQYQWGRKDPIRADIEMHPKIVELPKVTDEIENTHELIQHPDVFYKGSAATVATGKRYDNLWNTNVTTCITNNKADNTPGASCERDVEKTIYDPSPVGYCLPNMFAFSGFNPWKPIDQEFVPDDDAARNGIAKNPKSTFPSGYVDFYCGYKGSETYRRDPKGETIRIYVTGRRNGNKGERDRSIIHTGDGTNRGAFYWTSEPALWSDTYYSRALWFTRPEGTAGSSNKWQLCPVAGAPKAGQEKWQRTHALSVRPMCQP